MNYSTDGGRGQNYNGPRPPHFVHPIYWKLEKRGIKAISTAAALAILFYILAAGMLVGIIQTLFIVLEAIPSFNYNAFAEMWDSPDFQYAFDIAYTLITIGLPFLIAGRLLRKKGLFGEIPMGRPKNTKALPLVVMGAFGLCLLGNIITSYIDMLIQMLTGYSIEMPEIPAPTKSPAGILIFYIGIAVVPALVEEMAFRGVVMSALRRFGDTFAVVCSAILFGLMHCNLQQIPFAIMAGIFIGYAVVITDSLWTGIIIHFLNNAFSATVTLIGEFYGYESAEMHASNVIFYALIVIGIASAAMYYKTSNPKLSRSPLVNQGKGFYGMLPMNSAKVAEKDLYKAFFLTGAMLVAFLAVAYQTVTVMITLAE